MSLGNSKETYSYVQTIEEIKEFLQDLTEPYKEQAKTPAVLEPQPYMPPTAPGDDSQHESNHNQVMPPLRPSVVTSEGSKIPGPVLIQNATTPPVKALDVPLGDLSETFPIGPKETFVDQIKPTGSQMIDVTDASRMMFTDCQKTAVLANARAISNEGGQMETLNYDDLSRSQVAVLYGNQVKTSGDNQAFHQSQITTLERGHVMTFIGDQTLTEDHMTFSGDRMTTLKEGQMTLSSGNQTLYRSHMTITGGNQILRGGQMMTFKGDHMTNFADDHTPYGDHMVSYPPLSLPYPGFLYFPTSHVIEERLTEKQKQNLKTQSCQFQKNSDILRPYICTYQDCGKSYAKSSHLRIHERKHTGE